MSSTELVLYNFRSRHYLANPHYYTTLSIDWALDLIDWVLNPIWSRAIPEYWRALETDRDGMIRNAKQAEDARLTEAEEIWNKVELAILTNQTITLNSVEISKLIRIPEYEDKLWSAVAAEADRRGYEHDWDGSLNHLEAPTPAEVAEELREYLERLEDAGILVRTLVDGSLRVTRLTDGPLALGWLVYPETHGWEAMEEETE
jgi:hypothetical protein